MGAEGGSATAGAGASVSRASVRPSSASSSSTARAAHARVSHGVVRSAVTAIIVLLIFLPTTTDTARSLPIPAVHSRRIPPRPTPFPPPQPFRPQPQPPLRPPPQPLLALAVALAIRPLQLLQATPRQVRRPPLNNPSIQLLPTHSVSFRPCQFTLINWTKYVQQQQHTGSFYRPPSTLKIHKARARGPVPGGSRRRRRQSASPAAAAAASTRGRARRAASTRVALASLRAHATPWTMTTMTMDADEDGRCRRRTGVGAGDDGLTTAAPGGEDDGATDGRDGVARNEGNSCFDDKQTTGSLQTSSSQMEKHEVVCGDNARLKEEGATVDNMDPSRPFLYLEKFDQKKMDEWVKIKSVWAAKNVKNDIMTDPTPQLLFRHGASANVRTVGNAGTEDLLPLHIAVENTCMHKYLEDNLSPTQYNEDYVYKLIHLLCLPEMPVFISNLAVIYPEILLPQLQKIFLDTTRLLAEKTDNLVDELWNYMKDGKLVQSAVLLLTAQKQFRKVKPEGFHVIVQRLCCAPQTREKGDTGEAQKQLEEKGARFNCSLQLVSIISLAGEVLDKYIQAHSENVPLLPLLHGYVDSTKAVTEMSSMHSVEEKLTDLLALSCCLSKAVRKGALIGWDPTYTRRSFLPYWRSALGPRGPSQEAVEVKSIVESGQYWGSSMIPGYNRKIWLMDKIPQIQSRRRSRRYSSATALKMLVKVLKIA
ncbi:hypothetical protein OsJ_12769 [Oryza sativa Japonica Group]|uniref:Uncharacterized protein n=1 Tax=Oryza sativa subsp. japonica TaxID=39947 RepID=B9F5Y7_ORYSJ|nr:hypothetical protein OsJ_12769 [Oryza sativa Japonica Group]